MFCILHASIKGIRKEIKPLIYLYAGISLSDLYLTIAISYLLMQNMGIIGIGICWVLTNLLVAIFFS